MATVAENELRAIDETAINVVDVGTVRTLITDAVAATVVIFFAQTTTTSPATAGGTRLVIEGNTQGTGDLGWVPLAQFITGVQAANTTTVSGTEAAGQTVITLTSGTNFGPRTERIFFRNGTLANSEWHELVLTATNDITLKDPLANAQTGANVYDQAAVFIATMDVSGIRRVRLVVDNNFQATGPTVATMARIAEYAN